MVSGFDDWNSTLIHFGTKGMKWGVRKYQHEDGTYTEAGKERYFGPPDSVARQSILEYRKQVLAKKEKAASEKTATKPETDAEPDTKKAASPKQKKQSGTSSTTSKGKGKGKKKKKKTSDSKEKTKKGKAAVKKASQKGGFDGSIHNRYVQKASAKGHDQWESMSKIKKTAMRKPVVNIYDSARYFD